MDFGEALRALKQGKKAARSGWNGKGMWIALQSGTDVLREHVRPGSPLAMLDAETPRFITESGPATLKLLPHIDMRTADGSINVGWLASQTDMLSEDWEIVA